MYIYSIFTYVSTVAYMQRHHRLELRRRPAVLQQGPTTVGWSAWTRGGTVRSSAERVETAPEIDVVMENWLVVWNIFIFPYIGNNHPN